MMKPRIILFAGQEREERRAKLGDPLVGLAEHVDFEALAAHIDAAAPRPSRAKGGRPPYPTVLTIKILVLQQLYNLADDALEYQLLDRRSFLRFLDMTESSSSPTPKRSGCSATAWPKLASATAYSSRSSNNCCRRAIWRAAARSSTLRWSRLRFSATSEKRLKRSKKARCR